MQTQCRLTDVVFLSLLFCIGGAITGYAQAVHEQHVVIDHAAPGSNPMQAQNIVFRIPSNGNYQAVIFPERPRVAIKGIDVPIDVAIGFMTRDRSGTWRPQQWQHGTGNTFVDLKAMRAGTDVRIWYSSSIGGLPSPRIGGKVRIIRIQ